MYDGKLKKVVGKRQLKKNAIRKALLQATKEMCLEKSYQMVTLDEISKRAGVTKRTLYKHFPSKVALYINMIESYLETVKLEISRTVKLDLSSDKKFLALINVSVDFFRKNEKLMLKLSSMDIGQLGNTIPQKLLDRLHNIIESIVKDVAAIVKKCQEEGVIFEYDPRVLVHLVISILIGIYSYVDMQDMFSPADIKPEELFKAFFTVLSEDVVKIPKLY